MSLSSMSSVCSRCLPVVALFALLTLWRDPPAAADGVGTQPHYVTFCCQARLPLPEGEAALGEELHFAPCFEAPDTAFGRSCRSESLYYYPLALRTDRTFSFDNTTRELIVYRR